MHQPRNEQDQQEYPQSDCHEQQQKFSPITLFQAGSEKFVGKPNRFLLQFSIRDLPLHFATVRTTAEICDGRLGSSSCCVGRQSVQQHVGVFPFRWHGQSSSESSLLSSSLLLSALLRFLSWLLSCPSLVARFAIYFIPRKGLWNEESSCVHRRD